MTARKQVPRQANGPSEANDNERDFGLVLAMSAHRRQASQAGKMWTIYSQSHARYYMTFQQFQKPALRNKVLAGYGLEELTTPYDKMPMNGRRQQPKGKNKRGT